MVPYLTWAARDAADSGAHLTAHLRGKYGIWSLAPLFLVLFVAFGRLVVPHPYYLAALWCYLGAVVLNGLSYLEPLTLPVYIPGMMLEHFIRAAAILFGIFRHLTGRTPDPRSP